MVEFFWKHKPTFDCLTWIALLLMVGVFLIGSIVYLSVTVFAFSLFIAAYLILSSYFEFEGKKEE